MPDFQHAMLTTSPAELDIISTALGDNTNQFKSDDMGKAVKKGTAQNHVICAGGDEIEGFVDSVRGDTVNDGYSFGGVQRRKRILAQVGANQGVTPLAVNDLVVADVQTAFGTKGKAQVKTGVPATYLWQAIRVDGDGTAGTVVLLERQ